MNCVEFEELLPERGLTAAGWDLLNKVAPVQTFNKRACGKRIPKGFAKSSHFRHIIGL